MEVPVADIETTPYERLFQYEFEKQSKFMTAWKKFSSFTSADKLQESFIKVQVFFYSKEVEKVELDGYLKWLEENNHEVKVIQTEDMGRSSESTQDTNNVSNDESGEHRLAGKHPANFMELIEMIENGLKLPDTDDLNIEPTNEEPTKGMLARPKKPWENG